MSRPPVAWSWLDGALVLIGAFVIYFVGSVILAIIDYPIEHKHPGFWILPASYLCLTAGGFVMVHLWLIRRRGATWADVGFRIPHARSVGRGLLWTVGMAVCAYIVTIIGTVVIVSIFQATSFHLKSNVKELLPSGQSTVTVAQYIALVVLGGVLAPLTEETIFRGALYQGLVRDTRGLGKPAAIALAAIVTGCVFGLFHLIGGTGELYTLPLLAFLGIVLCLTFQLSGSLAGSMLLHATVNVISILTYYGGHLR